MSARVAGAAAGAVGVASAAGMVRLAKRLGVERPIWEEPAMILAGEVGVDEAIADLLSRPLREE